MTAAATPPARLSNLIGLCETDVDCDELNAMWEDCDEGGADAENRDSDCTNVACHLSTIVEECEDTGPGDGCNRLCEFE